MGDPMNPHVKIVFDGDDEKAVVSSLGIDSTDLFFFAYAEQVTEAGCKQIKQAVLAKTQEDFLALAPVAHAAGVLPVPLPVVNFLELKLDPKARSLDVNAPGVFLDDCCTFSRNVQVFALAGPAGAGQAPQVKQWDAQSIVVLQDDRNPDRMHRRVIRLHITPEDIRKDCTQL